LGSGRERAPRRSRARVAERADRGVAKCPRVGRGGEYEGSVHRAKRGHRAGRIDRRSTGRDDEPFRFVPGLARQASKNSRTIFRSGTRIHTRTSVSRLHRGGERGAREFVGGIIDLKSNTPLSPMNDSTPAPTTKPDCSLESGGLVKVILVRPKKSEDDLTTSTGRRPRKVSGSRFPGQDGVLTELFAK